MQRYVYGSGAIVQIAAIVAFMIYGPTVKSFTPITTDDTDSSTVELATSDHLAKRVDPLSFHFVIAPVGAIGEIRHVFFTTNLAGADDPAHFPRAYSLIIRGPPAHMV